MFAELIIAAYIGLKVPETVQPEQFVGSYEMVIAGGEYFCMMDKEDIDLMARVVMSEASTQSTECKEAVATVILNRVVSPKYPMGVKEVIQDQFSTADNGAPTIECYNAVYSAIIWYGSENQILPSCCYYFRGGHYHKWALDYCRIDDLYFSVPKGAVLN